LWGLRVLSLRPLHRRGGTTMTAVDAVEHAAMGPFVPRTTFLAPLLPHQSGDDDQGARIRWLVSTRGQGRRWWRSRRKVDGGKFLLLLFVTFLHGFILTLILSVIKKPK